MMTNETMLAQKPVAASVARRRKAEDFHVGQMVVVEDADVFFSQVANYVRGRVGVVVKVWPSDTPRNSPIRGNQLRVKWGKRNGRGVEKEMVMSPRDVIPADTAPK